MPRVSTSAVQLLQARLGLSDDELLVALDLDPLSALTGEVEGKPELALLLTLTDEAEEQVGGEVLRRWLRTAGPAGRPLETLLRRDFGAFEDALGVLRDRGFTIGGR